MAKAKKIYALDDAGRIAAEKAVEEWRRIAFRTGVMSPEERETVIDAVERLYRAGGLEPPPRARIVIAPSPMVARFATGAAAAIWHHRKTGADLHQATHQATGQATHQATDQATDQATAQQGEALKFFDFGKAWFVGAEGCAEAVYRLAGELGLACAFQADRMYQGGNHWSAWACWIAFGRDHAKLAERGLVDPKLYQTYEPWETLARLSGYRFMHPDFCIVSDRPVEFRVDDRGRPHHETGPYARWSDGTAFYAVRGVFTPAWIVDTPAAITTRDIHGEGNSEIRRIMMERYGWARYVSDTGGEVVHRDVDALGFPRELVRACPQDDEPIVMVRVTDSSPDPKTGEHKKYMLRVDPKAYGGRAGRECHAAIASTWRVKSDTSRLAFAQPEDYAPEVET